MESTTTGTATTVKTEKAKSSAIKSVKNPKAAAPAKTDVKAEAKDKNLESLQHLKSGTNLFIAAPRGGGNSDHLFKTGILPTAEKRRKSARKIIRKELDNFAKHFSLYHEKKNMPALKQLKADFDAYYKQVFKTNDYSLESILGGNTREARKESMTAMLGIIKNIK